MKKPAGFFSTLIITSLVCLIGTAHALSLSTPPVSDRGAGFDNVNGVAGPLASDNDGLLRVFGYTGSFCCFFRAALEFDVSSILPGSTITSSTLFLYDVLTVLGGNIEIHGYSGNGVVTLGSDFAVNNLVASYLVSDPGSHFLDVTSFLQSLVNGGNNYAGFMLRSSIEGPSNVNGADIGSKEHGNEAFRPNLTVDYFGGPTTTPEPSTMLLFGSGLVGLFGYRMRMKKAKA